MTKLIINADDFGMSAVFDEKILELLEREYMKSTSVLVNRLSKNEHRVRALYGLSRTHKVGVGLHVDLDISPFAIAASTLLWRREGLRI